MKTLVVINETHSLLPEQEQILKQKFDSFDFLKVPSSGWTLEEMKEKINSIIENETDHVVFVSPIPYMIQKLSYQYAWYEANTNYNASFPIVKCPRIWVFHNDNRTKKELPNGKIISVIAETGWQLV